MDVADVPALGQIITQHLKYLINHSMTHAPESRETIDISSKSARRLRRMAKDLGYQDLDIVVDILLDEHFEE